MAVQAWQVYDEFRLTLGLKTLNLNTDAIKLALFLSTSNCASVSLVTAQYATLTNELANGSGYTTGGFALTGSSYTETAGVGTFTSGPGSWTASGGSLVFRYAVLYDDTATNKDLIAFSTLDLTPADITILNGQSLNVTINALGIFTLT